jgi:hypothetical protein
MKWFKREMETSLERTYEGEEGEWTRRYRDGGIREPCKEGCWGRILSHRGDGTGMKDGWTGRMSGCFDEDKNVNKRSAESG